MRSDLFIDGRWRPGAGATFTSENPATGETVWSGAGASDADVEAYVQAFTSYATAVYESRLDQYKGQTLKVVGSGDNKPGDVTVNMIVVDPNARNQLRVAFRLLGGGGSYRFVDIQVEGIWLSIEQREQFAGFLSQNGGSVPQLTAHLTAQAQQINSGMAQR